MPVVKVLRGGQVTLPAALRKDVNLEEGDLLEAEIHDGVITLKPVMTLTSQEAKRRIKAIFAKSRGAGQSLSDAEVQSLIDEAITQVRREKRSKSR